jgi:hypothetical protein
MSVELNVHVRTSTSEAAGATTLLTSDVFVQGPRLKLLSLFKSFRLLQGSHICRPCHGLQLDVEGTLRYATGVEDLSGHGRDDSLGRTGESPDFLRGPLTSIGAIPHCLAQAV